jgi:hypothetical protein
MDSGEYEADNFEKLDFLIKLFSNSVVWGGSVGF